MSLRILVLSLALPAAAQLVFAESCHRLYAHNIPTEMRQAADLLLKSLPPDVRQQVHMPFEGERRKAWHYIPSSMMDEHGGRRGLPMKQMTPQQRLFAMGLLHTALSHRGQLQSTTIMALETVLRDLEGGNPVRDSEMYHVAIYGTPAPDKTWGWSFEGHHLSVNLTLVDGKQMSVTPSFWGSNPAIVPSGPLQGLDTLEAEQRLARELFHSLTDVQRQQAVIAEKAPRDVASAALPHVPHDSFQPPAGIPFEQLDSKQQQLLLRLVGQYAAKYRQPIVDEVAQRTPILDGKGMFFAWAGSGEPQQGHYYRIQTPDFLFEYDNTQNGGNHVHAVWRAFDGDFGEDLLREHYQQSPHHHAPE